MIARATLVVALVGLGVATSDTQAHPLEGVVRDVASGAGVQPIAHAANLPYGGGPVLHSNRTWLIFWQPRGSALHFDPGYPALFETFLRRVAADSHKPTNVYGLSGQYGDRRGPAAYNSTYGGAVVATDPLPPDGCTGQPPPPIGSGPGWSVCLDAAQLQTEIRQVIGADRLPETARDAYFLVTPNGLGSCATTGPTSCSLGGSADPGSYCGYHSASADGRIRYALIPYNAVPGHCQSSHPRPNANAADPAISSLSHEHNEIVTDPLGNAWIDALGHEEGDLCITSFGPVLGGAGFSAFNESIAGGHYYLQEEWSNDDGGCVPRAEADPVSFSIGRRPVALQAATFAAHASDPHGAITAYAWSFGDASAGRGRRVNHRFRRAGTYKVVLRTTDSADNWASATRSVRVRRA